MGLTQKLGTIPLAISTDASNNVGIGGSPSGSYKLEVTGTAKVSGVSTLTGNVFLSNGSGNAVATLGGSPTANDGASFSLIPSNSARNWAIRVNWNVAGALEFVPSTALGGSSFSSTPSMAISPAGYVGIGSGASANPSAYGYFAVSSVVTVNTLVGVAAGFSDNTYGTTRLYIQNGINGINVDQAFAISTGGGVPVERMRITSGGSVLINQTTDPYNHKLTSNGGSAQGIMASTDSIGNDCISLWNKATSGNNFYASFYQGSGVSLTGSIIYNRGAGLTAFNTTSDYRLKSEISDFNALEIISNLKPKEFRIGDAENKVIGFIAHELKEYFPQAVIGEKDEVKEDGTPIYQSVDYSQLTGLLVKAIQELNQQNQDLKSRLDKAGL